MAEQPGFWSAEGFPYPLLALGQTFPRGYQYQSQLTPYKRDARGDWGRALNESIDQFIGMYPQWLQQKRAFALQREQLARQRVEDQHRAKLRPFELRQLKANEELLQQKLQMRENYPQMVKDLPVDDRMKSLLLTQSPEKGTALINTYLAQGLKQKTKLIPAGTPIDGKTYDVDLQQKADGTLVKSPIEPKKITIQPKEVIPGTGGQINTYNVPLELNTADNSLSFPLEKPHTEVITLPVGDPGNPYSVPVEYNPKTKEWSFPLDKPPAQDFITVEPKGQFPDGTFNNSGRPQLYDRKNQRKIAHEGTSRPKNIVPLQEGNPLIGQLRNTFGKEWVNKMLPFLKEDRTYAKEGQPGQIIMPPGFEELNKELQQRQIDLTAPTESQLFQQKHSKDNYANIRAIGDLAPVAGQNFKAQSIAAVQLLPAGHQVRERAQYEIDKAGIKMGRNGVFVPEPFRPGPKGQKRTTQSEPKSTLVNPGETLDQIVERFKKQGVPVNKSQVIAANKHFFPEGDENKMKTSAQVEGAEMLIPVGGGQLSETDINAAHRSNVPNPRHDTTVIAGAGTYTNFNTTTVPFQYKLNNDYADMRKMQSNVDEVVELMKDPNALGLLKTGHPARGLIEGLRWRLINNVQVLRDFGVLSPSEIGTIAKSVPDINSTFNWAARTIFGLKPERFVKGVLGALKKEGETKASQLRAYMAHWNVPVIDFKIHTYDPYAGEQGQSVNIFQEQDSLEYTE
tara:strand:- start:8142 stop:10349 length:2208 start_codon:yes stop_codon:yes gene_type:complete